MEGDAYEFMTPWSPKIEVPSPLFFDASVNFEVNDAMIGVLESVLYIWVVGPSYFLGPRQSPLLHDP